MKALFVILVGTIGGLIYFGSRESKPRPASQPAPAAAPAQAREPEPHGYGFVLWVPNDSVCFAAPDWESFKEMMKAYAKNQNQRMANLALAGRVFMIPSMTPVRVSVCATDPIFQNYAIVELLEGQHQGEKLYVPRLYLKKQDQTP